jgi:hypothetical protein
MRKTAVAIVFVLTLSFMSCMVVVNEEDERKAKTDDSDTVTVIFSQALTGVALSSETNR